MDRYFYRAAAIVFGLLFVWVGRWTFFQPEKALKKLYSDLTSPTRFSNILFHIFGTMWVVIGLWAASSACVPGNLWDRYGLGMWVALIVVVMACTFLLLRRNDSSRLAHNPKR